MIKKIVLKESGKIQLTAAFLGTAIGFLLLLGAVQIYVDITDYLTTSKDLINPDYVIINKNLSILSTAEITSSEFTDSDIEELKKQSFIDEVAPFVANNFDLTGATKRQGNLPYYRTELFFEAVPDQYLDLQDERWKWAPGDSVIPIILPRDYLNLYNFGFAQSKGFPKVSAGMIGLVAFDIFAEGVNKQQQFDARIIGFSNRINSILVPYSFATWANNEFKGRTETKKPSRLLLVSNNPSDPRLLKFLEDKGYETNTEKLKNSRLNFLLRIILWIVSFIAAVIISLAFFVFVLGFQLMITKSKEKLRILLHLGYSYLNLSKFYIVLFVVLIVAINVVSFAALFFIKDKIGAYLTEMSFEIASGINSFTVMLAAAVSISIIIINSLIIVYQVRKIAK
jgi:hypothetical protein